MKRRQTEVECVQNFAIITMCQAKDFPEANNGLLNIYKARPSHWSHIILLNDAPDKALIARMEQDYAATVLCKGRNLGIAAGRNLLIQEALDQNVDYIFSIDNDFMIPADFFDVYFRRLREISAMEQIGISMPVVLDFNKAITLLWSDKEIEFLERNNYNLKETNDSILNRINSANRPQLREAIFHMGTRHWKANYFGLNGKEFHNAWPAFEGEARKKTDNGHPFLSKDPEITSRLGKPGWHIDIDTAPGGVCCYPASLIRKIGGVDEFFSPFGYEDAEFSIRALRAGAKNTLIGDAFLFHDFKGRGGSRNDIIKAAGRGRCRGLLLQRHVEPEVWPAATIASIIAEWNYFLRKDILKKNKIKMEILSGMSFNLQILAVTLFSSIYGALAPGLLTLAPENATPGKRTSARKPTDFLAKFSKTFIFLTRQMLSARTVKKTFSRSAGDTSFQARNIKTAFWADGPEDIEAQPDAVIKAIDIRYTKTAPQKLLFKITGLRVRRNRLHSIFLPLFPPEHCLSSGKETDGADIVFSLRQAKHGFEVSGSLSFSAAAKKLFSFAFFLQCDTTDNVQSLTVRDLSIDADNAWMKRYLAALSFDLEGLDPEHYETALKEFLVSFGMQCQVVDDPDSTTVSGAHTSRFQASLKDLVMRIIRDYNHALGYRIYGPDDKLIAFEEHNAAQQKDLKKPHQHEDIALPGPRKPGPSERFLHALSKPVDPLIRAINKSGPGQRLLGHDPFVEFKNTYAPTDLQKTLWRAKYRAASRGIPLSPNEVNLVRFHNRHRGERCFIIGNGPSLLKNDLSLLKNEITFGVNAIYLNKETRDFLPTHYVVEDVYVAEDRAAEINAWDRPYKWIGNYLRHCLTGGPRTTWINTNLDYRNYPGFPHFSTNAARQVYVGGTVSYICMQMAYFMGFSTVYLIGFDHSYQVKADVDKTGNKLISQSDDPNHFHKDYFGKGYRWHTPRVDRMEMAYVNARRAFEADGREIINATVGGHLDVLKRVQYEDIFK